MDKWELPSSERGRRRYKMDGRLETYNMFTCRSRRHGEIIWKSRVFAACHRKRARALYKIYIFSREFFRDYCELMNSKDLVLELIDLLARRFDNCTLSSSGFLTCWIHKKYFNNGYIYKSVRKLPIGYSGVCRFHADRQSKSYWVQKWKYAYTCL